MLGFDAIAALPIADDTLTDAGDTPDFITAQQLGGGPIIKAQ